MFLNILNVKFINSLIILGIIMHIHTIYSYICRAYGLNYIFVFSGVLSTIIGVILNLIFLIHFKLGYIYFNIRFIISILLF